MTDDDDDDTKLFERSSNSKQTPPNAQMPPPSNTTSQGGSNNSSAMLTRVQAQVNDVIDDMKINIEKVIDRGQNLNELGDRSEQLTTTGDLFSKRARSVRKSMWMRTCRSRMYLAIAVSVVLILFSCKYTYSCSRDTAALS